MLFKVLQTEDSDIVTYLNMIREFLVYLEYLRNDETVFCNPWTVQSLSVIDSKNCKKQGFDLLWDKIIEVKGPPADSRKKKTKKTMNCHPNKNTGCILIFWIILLTTLKPDFHH